MQVRRAVPADAPRLCEIYAPYVAKTAVTFATTQPAPSFYEEIMASGRPVLVAEEDGAVTGYAYAGAYRSKEAYRWDAEISIYVAEDCRGQGAGRALLGGLLALMRRLGYVNAYACITLPNPASIRLHESAGFAWRGTLEKTGWKLGRWHDVAWLALALSDAPGAPAEPLPASALSGAEVADLVNPPHQEGRCP